MPLRPRLLPLLALGLMAALPSGAHAAWFPADPVDGPSADIVSIGDVEVARDGMAGIAYVKRETGVEHVFVSRMVAGAWEAPVRIDQGILTPASQPVIAAANPDRMAVAWVSAGRLFTSIRAAGAPGFSPPRVVAEGVVSNPSLDMSINGVTYVSYTQAGDVKAARAPRDSPEFVVLPAPLDSDPAREAGRENGRRSQVAVSADGSAVVVWGERGADNRDHVFSRRLFELRLSSAVEDLTVAEFEGSPAGDASRPEIDIEDDSSYAQVAFRQDTARGPRVLARRLRGSQYEPPFAIDNGATATAGRVSLTGRGEGLTAAQGTGNEVFGGAIWNNALQGMQRWDSGPSGIASRPIPLAGENEDAAIAWFAGNSSADATVRGRYLEEIQDVKLQPEVTLSNPAFGVVDTGVGPFGGSTRVSDHLVAFIQGTGAERRLVASVYDNPPARPLGQNGPGIRRVERFKWLAARELWGPVTYRVFVDGRRIGETKNTELPLPPGTVSDGRHRWNAVAIDRRGQSTRGPASVIRIDNTPPVLQVSIGRQGRTVNVSVRRFSDRGSGASGTSRVTVDFGNGRRVVVGRSTSYTYPRGGSYEVRVRGTDRAGNRAVVVRTVRAG